MFCPRCTTQILDAFTYPPDFSHSRKSTGINNSTDDGFIPFSVKLLWVTYYVAG